MLADGKVKNMRHENFAYIDNKFCKKYMMFNTGILQINCKI